jgi:serine protease Do
MNRKIQLMNFYVVLLVSLFVLTVTVKASELSVPEIVNKVQPTIVVIESKKADGISRGSGFVVDSSGIVVTNMHVISGALNVGVKLTSGEVYDQIQIRAYDERKDLALIQIPGFNLPSATLGDSEQVNVGEKVVLIGNPLGVLEGSVTSGIVSGIRTIDGVRIIQTDASANPGNSGGPLLNVKGEVIGVLSFKLKGTENLNFVIPINYARGLLSIDNKF